MLRDFIFAALTHRFVANTNYQQDHTMGRVYSLFQLHNVGLSSLAHSFMVHDESLLSLGSTGVLL